MQWSAQLRRCVGVFWDVENCPIPSAMPGDEAASRVRAVVADFGDLVEFNAFGDVNLSSISKKHKGLREAGVNFIHTPHNSKKQVADMCIVADILAFALNRSSPTTVVLISNDGDFARAISHIQDVGHCVWIISNRLRTSGKLARKADGQMSWKYDVLERTFAIPEPTNVPCILNKADSEDKLVLVNTVDRATTMGLDSFFGQLYPVYSRTIPRFRTNSSFYSAFLRPFAVQTCHPQAAQGDVPLPSCEPVSVITSTASPTPHTSSCTKPIRSSAPLNVQPPAMLFHPLIETLQEQRKTDPNGTRKLEHREVVQNLKKRAPSVFAGCNGPKAYMSKARDAGIIHMRKGAKGQPRFVSLHPDYYRWTRKVSQAPRFL